MIFFGQWIEARSQRRLFRWISDYRVKAFLDAYHGPLRDNHCYWPGLLLVSRAVLLLVSAFNAFGDPSINLLATITCTVGLLTLVNHWDCILQNSSSSPGKIIFCKPSISCCWYNSTSTDREKPACPHLYLCGHWLCYGGILLYWKMSRIDDTISK